MNQMKIGKFIADLRKSKNMTQLQLAEKLGITDRAISKWENGKALPDASLMLDLCKELGITVNDLLSGEVVSMNEYNEKSEQNLIEMVKQKEKTDKTLLSLEILVGVMCMIVFFALVIFASYVQMEDWQRIVLIMIGFVPLLVATPFMLKIEQTAGYYQCAKCGHKYVPTYKSVFMAMHMGRTRYMKCPKCQQVSWQKKVISKE